MKLQNESRDKNQIDKKFKAITRLSFPLSLSHSVETLIALAKSFPLLV
jgi:hypothetical protein